jgi:flagellar operon protein (TIGR03826 family)
MNVRTCQKCRRLYQYVGHPLCPDCIRDLDNQFNDVKNYLYDNPGSSMEEVCEATGVDGAQIVRWLREGRLVTDDRNAALLTCITCGAPIRIGQYCEACKGNLQRTLHSTTRSMSKKEEPPPRTKEESTKKSKMHIKQ